MNRRFANWFEHELSIRSLSYNAFAVQLGVSSGSVNHWVHGRRTPSPKSCRQIADVLQVPPDVVLAVAGHRPPDVPLEEGTPESTLVNLIRQIDWLSDERIYRLVRDMLDSVIIGQQGTDERRIIPTKKMTGSRRALHVLPRSTDPDPFSDTPDLQPERDGRTSTTIETE